MSEAEREIELVREAHSENEEGERGFRPGGVVVFL